MYDSYQHFELVQMKPRVLPGSSQVKVTVFDANRVNLSNRVTKVNLAKSTELFELPFSSATTTILTKLVFGKRCTFSAAFLR